LIFNLSRDEELTEHTSKAPVEHLHTSSHETKTLQMEDWNINVRTCKDNDKLERVVQEAHKAKLEICAFQEVRPRICNR